MMLLAFQVQIIVCHVCYVPPQYFEQSNLDYKYVRQIDASHFKVTVIAEVLFLKMAVASDFQSSGIDRPMYLLSRDLLSWSG